MVIVNRLRIFFFFKQPCSIELKQLRRFHTAPTETSAVKCINPPRSVVQGLIYLIGMCDGTWENTCEKRGKCDIGI